MSSFSKFTTCPICSSFTPMLKREQNGKNIKETTSCPEHGLMIWHFNVKKGVRKFIQFCQKTDTTKKLLATTFIDRVDEWSDIRFTGTSRIRRIPPKRR